MKIILTTMFVCFTSCFSFGQNNNIEINKPIVITPINNGVRETSPTIIIERKDSKTLQVFEVRNNIKEISPSKEIKKTENGKIEVYKVVNNVREITPTVIIED